MSIDVRTPERFDRPPGAVLLDIDNTLYAYDGAHAHGMEVTRAKAERELSIQPRLFDEAFDEARRQIKARLQHTASSHSRLLYFQRMLELLGLKTQLLLALDLEQTYWRNFLSRAQIFDGVRGLLDDFRTAGIPTVVVTDLTAQVQFRKLVYFGLDHDFDYVVTSEEAGCDKPSAAPFEIAVEKLNSPVDTLWMIGDHPLNDIQGAHDAVDAVTLQKKHRGVTVSPDAALVFGHYGELRRFVRKILAREV